MGARTWRIISRRSSSGAEARFRDAAVCEADDAVEPASEIRRHACRPTPGPVTLRLLRRIGLWSPRNVMIVAVSWVARGRNGCSGVESVIDTPGSIDVD